MGGSINAGNYIQFTVTLGKFGHSVVSVTHRQLITRLAHSAKWDKLILVIISLSMTGEHSSVI